jgi:hypothetical protein
VTVDWAYLAYLPSFLRCTRVRRSSLRCFFFDMRLRRFLITEPMNSAIYSRDLLVLRTRILYPPGGSQHQTGSRGPSDAARRRTAQPASKYEVSSMSWTALACTRKDRPTRTAGSSPLCTSR